MKARAAAAAILVAVLAASVATARPFPPEPDYCTTRFAPGPIATSCPFIYGGARVTTFGATLASSSPAGITIEIVLNQGPGEQVLFMCTAGSNVAGPFALPTAECLRRSPVLPVAAGTELRCRHRGPGVGVFGCLSP
ncbi:MAG TPA: hypothetical protein VGB64_06580 [Actinomycetota bacterium]